MKAIASIMLFTLCLVSCAGGTLSGPPSLRLGRDECAECGMLINEDRCSCASIVSVDGRLDYALYDDIGCMLDHHRAIEDARVTVSFVHDHTTRAWVHADTAAFVRCEGDAISTPMGSGLLAFARAEDTVAACGNGAGKSMTYAEVAAARREYMERKWGKPEGGK